MDLSHLESSLESVYQLEICDEEGVEVPHHLLQDPEYSAGYCVCASEALSSWLTSQGFVSRVVDSRREDIAHTWVEVDLDGVTYQVDLTAAQFGSDDWPELRRLGVEQEGYGL